MQIVYYIIRVSQYMAMSYGLWALGLTLKSIQKGGHFSRHRMTSSYILSRLRLSTRLTAGSRQSFSNGGINPRGTIDITFRSS